MSVADGLDDVRNDPKRRLAALGAAAVLGLLFSTVHWIGLVAGGVGVGLASADLRRALVAGVGFGLLAWAVFAATLLLDGSFGAYLGTGQIAGLAVAIPVALGLLGSLARGIV